MSYTSAVFDVLSADATLTALVTVLLHKGTGYAGLNRTDYPAAYDANGLMRPNLVVKGNDTVPDRRLVDVEGQYGSTRQVVELWLHADRDAGWDTLEDAAERCYTLLQDRQVSGSFNVRLVNEIDEERDDDLGGACLARRDYEVIGFKGA